MSAIVSAQLRFAAALRGDSAALSLPGSSDAEFRASLTDGHTPIGLYYYYYLHAELAYLFGDAARAQALLARRAPAHAGHLLRPHDGGPVPARRAGGGAQAGTRADSSGAAASPGRWRAAASKLAHFARACPANFESHAQLAQAERARVHGDVAAAADHYTRAIAAARAHGAVKREALALELAARFYRAQGRTAEADAHRLEAVAAWRRFGATAKADASDGR